MNRRLGNIEIRKVEKDKQQIHEIICWRKNIECNYCYTIAVIDLDEDEPDINMIGNRYWELDQDDKDNFDKIVSGIYNGENRLVNIDDVCEWLKQNIIRFVGYDKDGNFVNLDFTDELKKAMGK